MSRLAVTGGRDFDDLHFEYKTLDLAHEADPITLLIHGSCWGTQTAPGADRIAEDWAKDRGVPYIGIPAWPRIGPATTPSDRKRGPIRNGVILKFHPKRLIAFPGGRGTADMLSQTRAYNRKHQAGRITRDIPQRFCWITEYVYEVGALRPRNIILRPEVEE